MWAVLFVAIGVFDNGRVEFAPAPPAEREAISIDEFIILGGFTGGFE